MACMAIQQQELNTVEIALAAINAVDKVRHIAYINSLEDVFKSAELAVFANKHEEALAILLGSKKVYKAIKTCLMMHKWEQALDIAVQYKTHIDTVLAYRARHLDQMGHVENSAKFQAIAQEVPYDWETVKNKEQMELDLMYKN